MNLITVVKSLAAFSWVALFGVIVFVVVRATRDRNTKGIVPIVGIVLLLAVVMNVLSAGLVFIEPTERGVVITVGQGGVRETALQPGLNWIIPFVERVVTYPISRQTYTMSIAHEEGDRLGDDSVEARTSDGQLVRVDASVIFFIDPDKVVTVHIDWQNTYTDEFIRTLSRGVIRDAVSAYGIEEVYSSKRQELSDVMYSDMFERLEAEGFVLVDFVLRNIAFSDEYAASVEQKQIAEQLAQQAAFVVDQRRQEAEQARQQAQGLADSEVIRAEGQAKSLIIQAQAEAEARKIQAEAEAKALELLGQAIAANPDVIQLQYIEKIAPNISVMLLPGNNPFLLPLPEFEQPISPATP
ncbi:MAG: SPFH domain-containing protein [Anaerolineales bacterium]|jgi:regulator of protease activity HflC (stomatin/prohibitin superfamily)